MSDLFNIFTQPRCPPLLLSLSPPSLPPTAFSLLTPSSDLPPYASPSSASSPSRIAVILRLLCARGHGRDDKADYGAGELMRREE
jgi:hypothetical protein